MLDNQWIEIAAGAGRTDLPLAQRGGRIFDCLPSPLNTVESGTGPSAITDAWVGGSCDPRRCEYLLINNGGHNDYSGNEGYALSLRSGTPAWRRISDPTPDAQIDTVGIATPGVRSQSSKGCLVYMDGRPRSDHTSGWPVWGDGQVWFLAMSSFSSGNGASRAAVYSYNRDMLGAASSPLAWTSANTGPYTSWSGIPGMETADANGSETFGSACWDPYDHFAYGFSGLGYDRTTFWYWRVKTWGPNIGLIDLAVANSGNPYCNAGWAVCAHDLRLIVIGDVSANQRVIALDISGASAAIPASAKFQPITNYTGAPPVAHHCSGGYVAKNNTIGIIDMHATNPSAISRIQIPTMISGGKKVYNPSGTWQFSTITPSAGATLVSNSSSAGTYGKAQLIRNMGDGRSAFIVTDAYNASTYLYKIPAAGL